MKTKMIVVVVLAAMCVLPLSAQVKVGVEGGMNLSHYLVSGSDGYKAEQVGGMKPGFQLGVTVDYEIGKHWMLMSGLSWLQNRSTMKMMDHMVTYFPKTEIKMNNLILPLKMGYNIRVSDKLSLIPSVGVYASYGFGAGNCSLDVIHQEGDNITTEPAKWKPLDGFSYKAGEPNNSANLQAFRRWDYGGIVGMKAVIADHYTISFDYRVGITKIQAQNGLRNSTFQFSVGYRF